MAIQATAPLPIRVGMAVPGAVLALAWIWVASRSPLAQAPHDRAAGTRVIRIA
jgi:ABC-type Fe3+ transport system permease subunit